MVWIISVLEFGLLLSSFCLIFFPNWVYSSCIWNIWWKVALKKILPDTIFFRWKSWLQQQSSKYASFFPGHGPRLQKRNKCWHLRECWYLSTYVPFTWPETSPKQWISQYCTDAVVRQKRSIHCPNIWHLWVDINFSCNLFIYVLGVVFAETFASLQQFFLKLRCTRFGSHP